MDKVSTALKRFRKQLLLGIALVVVSLLSIYSYRYELILLLPSVQADRLRIVSLDTQLPFPSSSRVVNFVGVPLTGPYPNLRTYWFSWVAYWEMWRQFGGRWYISDHEFWRAKIVIPESSYADFKEAVLKKQLSPFKDGPYVDWDKPLDPEFKRIIVGQGVVDCVGVVAVKEAGKYAIFVGYECK